MLSQPYFILVGTGTVFWFFFVDWICSLQIYLFFSLVPFFLVLLSLFTLTYMRHTNEVEIHAPSGKGVAWQVQNRYFCKKKFFKQFLYIVLWKFFILQFTPSQSKHAVWLGMKNTDCSAPDKIKLRNKCYASWKITVHKECWVVEFSSVYWNSP